MMSNRCLRYTIALCTQTRRSKTKNEKGSRYERNLIHIIYTFMEHKPHIPYDIYESPQELLILLPLWWINKKSIQVTIEDYRLVVRWERKEPTVKKSLLPLKQQCYWWTIETQIDLPAQVYFDKIHSKLSPENILEIIVPKALVPSKIAVEVSYDK